MFDIFTRRNVRGSFGNHGNFGDDNHLKHLVMVCFAPLLLCLPLLGCSKAPTEKKPEEIEKARQEHIQRSHREFSDG